VSDLPGLALDEALLARIEAAGRSEPPTPLWCKVVGMLQQNWAVILGGQPCVIVFCDDLRGVFDARDAHDRLVAVQQLEAQGFDAHREGDFPAPPTGTWHLGSHPHGRIYASGRFWRA